MRKCIIAIAVIGLFLFAGGVFAQQQAGFKIAVVDVKKASDGYDKTKASLKKLEDEVAVKQKEADPKKKEIETLQKNYYQQATMLSEEARKAKEQELKAKIDEYQKYSTEIVKNLTEKERVMTDAIVTDIIVAAQAVGKEEKYDFVFDKKSVVLGGDDITDKVIKRLNEKKAEEKKLEPVKPEPVKLEDKK